MPVMDPFTAALLTEEETILLPPLDPLRNQEPGSCGSLPPPPCLLQPTKAPCCPPVACLPPAEGDFVTGPLANPVTPV